MLFLQCFKWDDSLNRRVACTSGHARDETCAQTQVRARVSACVCMNVRVRGRERVCVCAQVSNALPMIEKKRKK